MERDEDMIFSVPIDHHEVERLRKEEGDGFAVGNYVILSNGGPAKIVEVRHATNFLSTNKFIHTSRQWPKISRLIFQVSQTCAYSRAPLNNMSCPNPSHSLPPCAMRTCISLVLP